MSARLLDLFCGAGGAAVGYHRAGFEVIGVDINPQPRYPFEFHQADAMTFPLDASGWAWRSIIDDTRFAPAWLDGFDAVHASPPCQDHSSLASIHGPHGTAWMLHATLERLRARREPWVVENVVGSGLAQQPTLDGEYGVMLCGASFGLGALGYDLARHRLFQSNVPISGPACACRKGSTMGVEGHGEHGHRYKRLAARPIARPVKDHVRKCPLHYPEVNR